MSGLATCQGEPLFPHLPLAPAPSRETVHQAHQRLADAERVYRRIKALYVATSAQHQASIGRPRMRLWHKVKAVALADRVQRCEVERARAALQSAREGWQ